MNTLYIEIIGKDNENYHFLENNVLTAIASQMTSLDQRGSPAWYLDV